jgi:hypothetical protein
VDLSRSGRVIPAELSEMSYVNFKEEFENTLRRLCDVAPEKIPVTLKGEEFRPANRNVPSRKYGGKGPRRSSHSLEKTPRRIFSSTTSPFATAQLVVASSRVRQSCDTSRLDTDG